MTKNLAKWTSEHGQTANIRPSDGCRRIQLPLAVPIRYDCHGFEGYLGNVSLIIEGRRITAGTTMPTRTQDDPSATDSMPWCANPFVEWLLTEAWNITSTRDLVGGLCRRLVDDGTPLWRMFLLIRTLHP